MIRSLFAPLLLVAVAAKSSAFDGHVAKNSSCNLILNGTDGDARSPGYPFSMANDTLCVWQFQVKTLQHVYFMVDEFSLLPGDSLLIYKNHTLDELVGNFTGRLDPFVAVTYSTNVTVLLITGPTPTGKLARRVHLNYSVSACSIKLTKPGQVIRSPVYIPSGKGNVKCDYHIDMEANSTKAVTLSFTKFDLLKGAVKIYDGLNKKILLDSYTDKNASSISDVVATGTSVVVEMMFSLSPKILQQVVASAALVDAECSGMVKAPLVLRSPGYPLEYKSGLDCRWIVVGPNGTTLLANMMTLDLGDEFDYVAVHDRALRSADSLVTYRNGAPRPLAGSSRNRMWVRFFSDESQSGQGFVLNITVQGYGGRFSGKMGKIGWGLPASPFNNTVESYWITAADNTQVQLKINSARMFPMSSITCYSGDQTVVALFRTNTPFYTAFSNDNKMRVIARGFNGSQYFRATYQSVSKGSYSNMDGRDGAISWSASDLVNKSTYVILKHPGVLKTTDSLVLTLKTLKLGQNETVTVYDGLSEQDTPLVKYNSSTVGVSVQSIRASASRGFRLEYRNNSKNATSDKVEGVSGSVLNAVFTTINSECPQPMPGVFISPGYPFPYAVNGYCRSNTTTPAGRLLHVSFDTIKLQPSHTVKIFSLDPDSSKRLTFNGTQTPDDVILNIGSFGLEFAAPIFKSGAKVGKGFNITYEFAECGSVIDLTNGSSSITVQTPGYPKLLKNKTTCVWLIRTDAHGKTNGSVNVLWYSYSFAGLNNNTDNNIYLYDGGSSLSEVRPFNMSVPQNKSGRYSATNKMIIKYVFNPSSVKHQGFAFKMNVNIHECTKEHQCANGRCMLPSWRCDGIDQCGDMTDEKDCTTITTKYIGVPTWGFVLALLAALVVGVVFAVVVPCVYRRARNPNYRELRDLMVPVPT